MHYPQIRRIATLLVSTAIIVGCSEEEDSYLEPIESVSYHEEQIASPAKHRDVSLKNNEKTLDQNYKRAQQKASIPAIFEAGSPLYAPRPQRDYSVGDQCINGLNSAGDPCGKTLAPSTTPGTPYTGMPFNQSLTANSGFPFNAPTVDPNFGNPATIGYSNPGALPYGTPGVPFGSPGAIPGAATPGAFPAGYGFGSFPGYGAPAAFGPAIGTPFATLGPSLGGWGLDPLAAVQPSLLPPPPPPGPAFYDDEFFFGDDELIFDDDCHDDDHHHDDKNHKNKKNKK